MIRKAYFFEWWFWFKFNNSQQWERGLQLKVNFFCRLISSFWEDGVKWKILEVNLWKKYFLQIFLQLLPLFYTKQNKTQLEEGKNRQFWKNQIHKFQSLTFMIIRDSIVISGRYWETPVAWKRLRKIFIYLIKFLKTKKGFFQITFCLVSFRFLDLTITGLSNTVNCLFWLHFLYTSG